MDLILLHPRELWILISRIFKEIPPIGYYFIVSIIVISFLMYQNEFSGYVATYLFIAGLLIIMFMGGKNDGGG